MSRFEPTEEVVGMKKPELNRDMSRMIAVVNLPEVGDDKYEKLARIIKKIVTKSGELELADHEYAFFMPRNESNVTKGILFAEFKDAKSAEDSIGVVSGKKLDHAHILQAFSLAEYEQVRDLPDSFVPEEPEPFVANDRDFSWLEDERVKRGCEMFATHVTTENNMTRTNIQLFNPRISKTPEVLYKGENLARLGCCWSPSGTYFVAMVPNGAVALTVAGNPVKPESKIKMKCNNVSRVEFSPFERYIFTSGEEGCWQLWDVAGKRQDTEAVPIATFPFGSEKFSWDGSERYCVRRANPTTKQGKDGAIEVYDVSEKKTTYVKAPGVSVVSVSPRDPYVACFTPDKGGQGATVSIMDFRTGKILRSQTVLKAISCTFFWHPEGRFLAAQVDSIVKGKHHKGSCLSLFRMDERQIPLQMVDESPRRIIAFAWESGLGSRFAFSSTDAEEKSPIFGRIGSVSIYDMRGLGQQAVRVNLVEKKPSSLLSWAPQQGVLLMCDITTSSGDIEFFDVKAGQTLNKVQHLNTTSVQWDPSGRYVALISSLGRGAGDSGFDIYSFTGRPIYHVVEMGLKSFLWRQHPTGIFDQSASDALRKKLQSYREEFKREEQMQSDLTAQETARKKQAINDEFQAVMGGLLNIYDKERGKLRELYHGYDPRNPDMFVVEQKVTESPVA